MINAFFAASEIALISLNDNKIRLMAEEGNKKAKLLKHLLGEPSRFLATIQIGITLAGFLASAFAADSFSGRLVNLIKLTGIPIPDSWLKSISMVFITLILSYFTLVLGELVPKRLAMKKAESISMFVVGPLNILSAVTSPFVKLLTLSTNFFVRLFGVDPHEEDEKVTEEEIRMMIDVGEEKGTIHESEKLMINNIFEFNNKTVSDIMTHRTDIVALPVGADLVEVLRVINIEKYSRIPVYNENIDDIIGILHTKDLIQYITDNCIRDNFSLKKIMRKPFFVPASKRTDELFKELQQNRMHIAIIIDEYGGTAGIVTLEDLIEEIVGNIFDEDDEEIKFFDKLDENTFMINGSTSLDDVKDYLDVELPIEEYETLSGFVIGQLGRIPGKEDNPTVEYNGLVFKVEGVEEKRLTKVKVCKA
jgi:Hemolysins and related proteins containing CBS domains